MNILTVDNITKSYGVRKIFDGASFFLQEGEKAGIIGINGTGKSTLLKMIAGLEEADDGTVIKANHCLVRYLPQNPEFAPEETVLEAVLRGNRVEENAGTIEADAKSMLTKLGVTEFDQPCGQLSGGQRKRLALVSVLLSPAEILLLDEPTNHLDNSMSDWLEEQLRRRKGAMIMVTHDRYFLDSVTDRILELDKGKIFSYDANYSGFLELKAQREEIKTKKLLSVNEKYYCIDPGFYQLQAGVNKSRGQILENVVFLELIRRKYRVTVGNIGKQEIDFICRKHDKTIYIQVSESILDENTREREFNPLEKISDNYPKYVLTLDDWDYSKNGITHLNVIDFLKNENI